MALIPFPKIKDVNLIQLKTRIIGTLLNTLLFFFIIAIVCLSITAMPLLVWFLWNWLVPVIFVQPILARHITLLQAYGVIVLYFLIFKYSSYTLWSVPAPFVFDFIDKRTWDRELYNKVVGIISIPAIWRTICVAGPIAVVLLHSLFIYLLWNWLVPLIFVQPNLVTPHLTFPQAWGVGLVCSLLFRPIRSGKQLPQAAPKNETQI